MGIFAVTLFIFEISSFFPKMGKLATLICLSIYTLKELLSHNLVNTMSLSQTCAANKISPHFGDFTLIKRRNKVSHGWLDRLSEWQNTSISPICAIINESPQFKYMMLEKCKILMNHRPPFLPSIKFNKKDAVLLY